MCQIFREYFEDRRDTDITPVRSNDKNFAVSFGTLTVNAIAGTNIYVGTEFDGTTKSPWNTATVNGYSHVTKRC